MSKLEQMIKELCPEGVEYVKIGDIATVNRGVRVTKNQLSGTGTIPVYQNSMTPLGYYDKSNCSANTAFVIGAGAAGEIGYCPTEFWAADDCYYFICNDNLNSKFLYYCLMKNEDKISSKVRKASIPRISRSVIENIVIPLPPLEIQAEIVRILDNFTNLTAELTAELEARKKQYEYYRDKLLDFGTAENERGLISECEWRTLGEISMIVRGASPRPIKNFITNDSNGIPWIKIGDVLPKSKYITNTQEKITKEGAEKSRFVHKGDFILSNSMSFGRPYILKIDGCIHDGWLSISGFDKYVSADYLYYALTSGQIQQEMKKRASFGGAVQNLNSDIVKAISIPIPPKKEQERIVAILDRFDKLCNDIYEGLPAEIEARKKQYEYYRDRLLSFKER